ncbi:NAD-dependent epimerase/dehydratase family protein [Burkholderiaceae bacterium UC74_6]
MIEEELTALRFERILLTGAAGNLGRVLRPRLKRYCNKLRLSDMADLGLAAEGEELFNTRLEDKAAVSALLEGVDAVIHFGGLSTEHDFESILEANIRGSFHIFDAARKHGVKRVIFASSVHATGFYKQSETITPQAAARPDGNYGLSKAFGEDLAQFYFDRYGVESVSVRIGSCWPEPVDRRMLASWLSFDDMERLLVACLTAPVVGHSTIYGVSDNRQTWWDNNSARHIGYKPKDSSEQFRLKLEAKQPHIDTKDPVAMYQGGAFVTLGPFE